MNAIIRETNEQLSHDLPRTMKSSSLVQARRYLKRSGLYGLGEAYMNGEVHLDRLDELLEEIIVRTDILPAKYSPRVLWHLLRELWLNPQRGKGIFEVAQRHYDLGNDLFSAMLDSSMSYTCGIWRGARNLEEAQNTKLDLICRKLELKPGMKVLDIGCGWGNFAAYASARYGVSVVGLTVSKEQAVLARERCEGLPVEILLQGYEGFSGQFDRIVSIEMIEAVGKKNLSRFFSMIDRCLVKDGRFLLQAISGETFTRSSHRALDQFVIWLLRYIFPNGYLPTLKEITQPAQGAFVIEHMENFGLDYEKTLAAWQSNFERSWGSLAPRYGDRFRLMWRYYLCGCRALFRRRMVHLYQVVYRKSEIIG